MKYRVLVDDNFHFMDESERDEGRIYQAAEEALSAARQIVDDSLRHLFRSGYTPKELYDDYKSFGDDPFITTDDKSYSFSAWNYAEKRCAYICDEMFKKNQ